MRLVLGDGQFQRCAHAALSVPSVSSQPRIGRPQRAMFPAGTIILSSRLLMRFPWAAATVGTGASAMRSRNCSTCSPVFADSALSGLGAFSALPVNAADQDAGVRLFSFPIPHCLNAALRSLS